MLFTTFTFVWSPGADAGPALSRFDRYTPTSLFVRMFCEIWMPVVSGLAVAGTTDHQDPTRCGIIEADVGITGHGIPHGRTSSTVAELDAVLGDVVDATFAGNRVVAHDYVRTRPLDDNSTLLNLDSLLPLTFPVALPSI